ncbi:MAG TPA: hypothetical protein VFD04_18595 [Actinomycetes bacterium]|jgi:hypothetical protein|nr:hypothetical protein [Actinomycetes bacterium]
MVGISRPLIVRWDGPEDADLRRRVERAVAAGVWRAVAATSRATPSYPDGPGGGFTGWGPDPERGAWVLPSYEGEGEPVAVPVQGSVATDVYGSDAELRGAIAEAFPASRGAPRPGIFYGIYGRLSGNDRPYLYYVRLEGGREVLDSIFLWSRPKSRARYGVKEELQRVAISLDPGYYTVIFRPHGHSLRIRTDQPSTREIGNPHGLDLTVTFAVDPLHVAVPQRPPWRFVPLTQIQATNPASPLATDAESFYVAFTELWEVDEYGRPQTVDPYASIGMLPFYTWEITKLSKEVRAGPDVVHRVSGYDQRIIRHTWKDPGTYQVKLTVTVHGTEVSDRPVDDTREERVQERGQLMSLQLEALEQRQRTFLEHPGDPRDQVWVTSATELLNKFEADLAAEQAKPKPNDAKVDDLKKAIRKLRKQLYQDGRTPADAFPIHAVYMEQKTSQTRPVSLFLAFELRSDIEYEGYSGELIEPEPVDKPYHWYFIDLTYPASYRTYTGKGTTVLEGLEAAFHDSETSIRRAYPPGQILARVTREDLTRHGITVPANFPTAKDFVIETDSWQKDAWEWFTLGVQVVGVLALPAAIVFPPLAPVLVVVSLAGAVISVVNIADRVAHNDFAWDTETFADLANIVAALAQVGAVAAGSRTTALARAVNAAEDLAPATIEGLKSVLRVQRALLLTQLGTDAANALILGYSTWQELRAVDAEYDDESLQNYQHVYGAAEGKQRWLREREARINGIFAHAIFGGAMIVVSTAGGLKGLHELGKVSETVRQLGDPSVRLGGPGEGPAQQPRQGEVPGPVGRWKSLEELQRAAAADPEAAPELAWYQSASDEQLLARAVQGDPVATTLLQRAGGAGQPGPSRPLDRFFTGLLRVAGLRDRAGAASALRLLPPEQLSELMRLAELVDVPENVTYKLFRAAARDKGVLQQVDRLADWLSLARRVDKKAAAGGGLSEHTTAALGRLLETGWGRKQLAGLVDAVPTGQLADWSLALTKLRPDQVQRLGAGGLETLAYSNRALRFIADGGADAYLSVADRAHGNARAIDSLLQGLELRKAEVTDPAEYQRLLDRVAAGEPGAFEELGQRISKAAGAALDRLRQGRRQLQEELEESEELIQRLRQQGNATEAAQRTAERDRLAASIGELGDKELNGLEQLARLGEETGGVNWESALDLPPADRAELLTLFDDVAGRLPHGSLDGLDSVMRSLLERQPTKTGRFDFAVQGSWGQLYAARTLITDPRFGATALEFESPRPGRVLDMVANLPGRGPVTVEVKTNLGAEASFAERQVLSDLATHARSGYDDLLYLYHPDVAGQLPEVGQRMLALFDQPALQELLRAGGVDVAKAKAAFQAWLKAGNLGTYRL